MSAHLYSLKNNFFISQSLDVFVFVSLKVDALNPANMGILINNSLAHQQLTCSLLLSVICEIFVALENLQVRNHCKRPKTTFYILLICKYQVQLL